MLHTQKKKEELREMIKIIEGIISRKPLMCGCEKNTRQKAERKFYNVKKIPFSHFAI
jgi:hypothetical protein